jgi:hypothetical protein
MDLMNHEARLKFSTEPCLHPLSMPAGIQEVAASNCSLNIGHRRSRISSHVICGEDIQLLMSFALLQPECRATEQKDSNSARSRVNFAKGMLLL